jgi:hypothetical protein
MPVVLRPSALMALQGEVALTREMATRVEESVLAAIENNGSGTAYHASGGSAGAKHAGSR